MRSSNAGPHRPSPAGPARLLDPLPDLHPPAHDLAGRVLAGSLWTAERAHVETARRHKILVLDDADGFLMRATRQVLIKLIGRAIDLVGETETRALAPALLACLAGRPYEANC